MLPGLQAGVLPPLPCVLLVQRTVAWAGWNSGLGAWRHQLARRGGGYGTGQNGSEGWWGGEDIVHSRGTTQEIPPSPSYLCTPAGGLEQAPASRT